MQEVTLKGKVITRPVVRWLTEYRNTEITRFIIEKEQTGRCSIMIVCFGEWASKIGNMVNLDEMVTVCGRLRGYVFHDADNAPHYVTFLSADKIITEDKHIDLSHEMETSDFIELEENCLEIMNEKDYLPISEDEYEQIIESAGDQEW